MSPTVLKTSSKRPDEACVSSAKRAPGNGVESSGQDGREVLRGSNGIVGSGTYAVGWNGAVQSEQVEAMLKGYREDGTAEKVWEHFQSEFKRIEATE